MSTFIESHDYLPYIDSNPTDAELASASSLLASEAVNDDRSRIHPSVSTSYEPQFSDLLSASFSSITETGKARAPSNGIELARYEEPSAPESSGDTAAWRQVLRSAYTSHAYLAERQLNLSLLEKYGKNAWLIANSQVEDELKAIEREAEKHQRELHEIETERKRNQIAVAGELEGLEETWKTTVGRAIEAEVASEVLNMQISDKRRLVGTNR